MLDSRKQVGEQQTFRHPETAGLPVLRLYEVGSPEELEDPVRISELKLIQFMLKAVDKEHECLWVDA